MDRILEQLTLEGMGWPELRQQVWWERIPKYLDGATSDFHKRKRLQAWQLGQDQICERFWKLSNCTTKQSKNIT